MLWCIALASAFVFGVCGDSIHLMATKWFFCNINCTDSDISPHTTKVFCYWIVYFTLWHKFDDYIYLYQTIVKVPMIGNLHGKFGEKILSICRTLQHFVTFSQYYNWLVAMGPISIIWLKIPQKIIDMYSGWGDLLMQEVFLKILNLIQMYQTSIMLGCFVLVSVFVFCVPCLDALP